MPSKVALWLNSLTTKRIFYWIYLLISLFTLTLFTIFFISLATAKDIDNSGMGLIVAFIPAGMTALLLYMSLLALFYYLKKRIPIPISAFIFMFLLSIAVLLFGCGMLSILRL